MAEDWVERRQRAVKCPIHGLHYDPEMMSACPKCRRENLAQAPKQRPQVLVFLLSILGLVIVFYRMFGPDGFKMPDYLAMNAEQVGTPPIAVKLDPQAYRGNIEPLENLLFDVQDETLSKVGDDIVARAADLVEKIRDREPTERMAAADAIENLTFPLIDEPLTTERLEALRKIWPRMRATYFDWANWYASPQQVDRLYVDLTIYRDVADDLWSLLDEARSSVARLAEPVTPGFGEEDRRRERDARWTETSRSLQERLHELRDKIPARPPASAESRLLLAIQHLEQSLQEADSHFRNASLLNQQGAAERFDSPLRAVEQARADLNTLLRN